MPTYAAKSSKSAVKVPAVKTTAARLPKPSRSIEGFWAYHSQKQRCTKHQAKLRNQLVEENKNLAREIAHRFLDQCNETYEDLEQLAMIGLMRAIENFDPTQNNAFSSFAVPHIRGEILHHLRKHGTTVKIPRRWRELYSNAQRVERQWILKHGIAPTDDEIADELGCRVQRLREVKAAIANQASIPLDEQLHDTPTTEANSEPIYVGKLEQAFQQLRRNLQQLPEGDRNLIQSLYMQRTGRKAVAKSLKLDAATLRSRVTATLVVLAN